MFGVNWEYWAFYNRESWEFRRQNIHQQILKQMKETGGKSSKCYKYSKGSTMYRSCGLGVQPSKYTLSNPVKIYTQIIEAGRRSSKCYTYIRRDHHLSHLWSRSFFVKMYTTGFLKQIKTTEEKSCKRSIPPRAQEHQWSKQADAALINARGLPQFSLPKQTRVN